MCCQRSVLLCLLLNMGLVVLHPASAYGVRASHLDLTQSLEDGSTIDLALPLEEYSFWGIPRRRTGGGRR